MFGIALLIFGVCGLAGVLVDVDHIFARHRPGSSTDALTKLCLLSLALSFSVVVHILGDYILNWF